MFRLAKQLGRTVPELLDSASARDIEEMIVFERIEADDEKKAMDAASKKPAPRDDED